MVQGKTWMGVALCVLSLSLVACGDDDGAAGTSGSGGTGGTGGAGGTGGDNDSGTAGTGGDTDSGAPGATAEATLAPFGSGTITGTATFTQDGDDVTVTITLNDCADGDHPVHIHEGTSCADATAQGGHWDMARGEGIPVISCANDTGTVTYTRVGTDAKPWTIGGDATTNVIGHAFVVHDGSAMRVGCGIIEAQ